MNRISKNLAQGGTIQYSTGTAAYRIRRFLSGNQFMRLAFNEVTDQVDGIAFDTFTGDVGQVELSFDFRMGGGNPTGDPWAGADGLGVVLLNTTQQPYFGTPGICPWPWTSTGMPEEPNVEGSIGVGLDTWPNFDIGDPDNNHVSLHFNGTPIKAVGINPAELNLEDNAWHSAVLMVDLVTGSVQFSIDGKTYIDEVLFGVSPCVQLRPAFYARTGGAYNDHDLDNIRAETRAEALPTTFLDESFDTTTLPFNGWEWGVEVSERGYVEGVGVGGSQAIQMSGHFIDWGGFAMACYQPSVECNGSATRANTRMSFDVKTDVPGRQLSVGLTSWKDNHFGGAVGFMVGDIPLAPTNPGEFQTIDICLGSSIWHFPPWDPNITDLFDPSAGTIGTYFQAEAWNFGGIGSSLTVTVDNLKFYTVPEVPNIEDLEVSASVLWPPNHKMVEVTVDYDLDFGCHLESDISTTLSVTSNEPVSGLGDGDTAPDWEVVDAHHVRLRAERSGKGNGRIYTITVTCADKAGNLVSKDVSVSVPKNK